MEIKLNSLHTDNTSRKNRHLKARLAGCTMIILVSIVSGLIFWDIIIGVTVFTVLVSVVALWKYVGDYIDWLFGSEN